MGPKCFLATFATLSVILGCLLTSAEAIQCHQCDSNNHLHCSEQWDYLSSHEPQSCDYLYEAAYCIKATGMYEGRIGTFRFCSSRDRGNYCDYVQRPGDEREYRACIHTCRTDGCNSSPRASKLDLRLPTSSPLLSLAVSWQLRRA
uniref:Putative conserved secreted protein n=1 Tax=Ixodes ricinus TaxID=34613 RepID=V5GNT0_IXORI